jgi:hypothetical protein
MLVMILYVGRSGGQMRGVKWRVCGSDLRMCLLKELNQGKVLLLDLYLQSIKSQYLLQVNMKQNNIHT